MQHVKAAGFPVPAVHDLRAGDTELVMERLEGPTMAGLLLRRPWRMAVLAAVLAQLHRRLGAISAPPGLRQLPDGGGSVVHLDLHPLNVIMTGAGPVVIDWTNAARGRPETDLASTWVIIRSSEIPGSTLQSAVGAMGRRIFLHALLRRVDRAGAEGVLAQVISARLADRNVTPGERRFLTSWLARLGGDTLDSPGH